MIVVIIVGIFTFIACMGVMAMLISDVEDEDGQNNDTE